VFIRLDLLQVRVEGFNTADQVVAVLTNHCCCLECSLCFIIHSHISGCCHCKPLLAVNTLLPNTDSIAACYAPAPGHAGSCIVLSDCLPFPLLRLGLL